MAQDGSQPWEATGAFPYLMHHPKDPLESASYGQERVSGQTSTAAASTRSTAKTGTWDGPAPRGYSGRSEADQRAQSSVSATVSQPSSLLLPGGSKMPLVGFGTDKISSADVFRGIRRSGPMASRQMHRLLSLYNDQAGRARDSLAVQYGNETLVGEALRPFIESHGRAGLFITSKIWNNCHRPELVRQSCETSLRALGCGHLDLLLMHWPEAWLPGTEEKPDPDVTIEETWRAMEALHDAGLARSLGVSNFSLVQVEQLLGVARIKPVVNQVELHPLLAQRKLVGTCARKGVACVAYSPLGHGTSLLLDNPEVRAVAEELRRTPAQVLLRWNVQRGVAVIPRSQTDKNVRANIDGLFDWELSPEHKVTATSGRSDSEG